jgi:hypothetical protein
MALGILQEHVQFAVKRYIFIVSALSQVWPRISDFVKIDRVC